MRPVDLHRLREVVPWAHRFVKFGGLIRVYAVRVLPHERTRVVYPNDARRELSVINYSDVVVKVRLETPRNPHDNGGPLDPGESWASDTYRGEVTALHNGVAQAVVIVAEKLDPIAAMEA